MSSEERRKILQMVEEGKISPEEAASLMRALDEDAAEEILELEVIQPAVHSGYEKTEVPEFESIKSRARRFALIPLWAGILITVFSGWAMYAIQQNAGMNFWFLCMIVSLMLGVLLIALGSGGRSSRWFYVDVNRQNVVPGDGPHRITFGLPIPVGLVEWFFEHFGHNIHGMDDRKVQGIIQMMRATRTIHEPLTINVDDEDAHVQLYIG